MGLSGCSLEKNDENRNISFAILGHLYPITQEKERLEQLIKDVNKQSPDYVFVLGDSGVWEGNLYDFYRDKFNSPVYFAIGNHDYQVDKDRIKTYLSKVGYLDKLLITDSLNFIILNSGNSLMNVKDFLNQSLAEVKNSNPTVILCHHQIWDDNLMSKHPFMHDKSYYFKDLFPILDGKVDYIFAGNSNRHYFSHDPSNTDVVYWVNKYEDIECYSCGAGNAKPKTTFAIAKLIDKELVVKPFYSSIK